MALITLSIDLTGGAEMITIDWWEERESLQEDNPEIDSVELGRRIDEKLEHPYQGILVSLTGMAVKFEKSSVINSLPATPKVIDHIVKSGTPIKAQLYFITTDGIITDINIVTSK